MQHWHVYCKWNKRLFVEMYQAWLDGRSTTNPADNWYKGELGFFIHSKGGGVPYRMKIRSPSFINLSILPQLLQGSMMSDTVAILGSLDFVMGECDR